MMTDLQHLLLSEEYQTDQFVRYHASIT